MRKLLFWTFLFIFVIGPAVFVFAALESAPLVKNRKTATSADAVRAKSLLDDLLNLTAPDTKKGTLKVSLADLNSLVALGTRVVPTLRGTASINTEGVQIASSLKVPGQRWLNAQLSVAPSASGLKISSVRLGAFELPAGVVLPVLRFALDTVFGNNVGTILTTSVDGVAVNGRTLRVGISLSQADSETITTSVKRKIRTVANVSLEEVRHFYRAIDDSARQQGVRSGGTVVPFLRLMMNVVAKQSEKVASANIKQSALLALAIYCGHQQVQDLIGDVVPKKMSGKRTRCSGATLGRRRDLSQHFTISAGLRAASSSSVAFTVGEFKELLDSTSGGSGFSFDDLAADRAGIRFADVLMNTELDGWPQLVNRLSKEADVFPSLSGLPAGLSDREFEHRYGDVDSPAYKKVLADIERRITGLPFFDGQQ